MQVTRRVVHSKVITKVKALLLLNLRSIRRAVFLNKGQVVMEKDILFAIGEICMDVSYGNITAEEAINMIREKYLDYVYRDKQN